MKGITSSHYKGEIKNFLNSTDDNGDVITFKSDLANLCTDSCITRDLTRFIRFHSRHTYK